MGKRVAIILVCLLTLYAPLELTRVIIAWGLAPKFIFEIVVIWVGYLFAVTILIKVVKGKVSV